MFIEKPHLQSRVLEISTVAHQLTLKTAYPMNTPNLKRANLTLEEVKSSVKLHNSQDTTLTIKKIKLTMKSATRQPESSIPSLKDSSDTDKSRASASSYGSPMQTPNLKPMVKEPVVIPYAEANISHSETVAGGLDLRDFDLDSLLSPGSEAESIVRI